MQGDDGISFVEYDNERLNYFSYPCVVESISREDADRLLEENSCLFSDIMAENCE